MQTTEGVRLEKILLSRDRRLLRGEPARFETEEMMERRIREMQRAGGDGAPSTAPAADYIRFIHRGGGPSRLAAAAAHDEAYYARGVGVFLAARAAVIRADKQRAEAHRRLSEAPI